MRPPKDQGAKAINHLGRMRCNFYGKRASLTVGIGNTHTKSSQKYLIITPCRFSAAKSLPPLLNLELHGPDRLTNTP